MNNRIHDQHEKYCSCCRQLKPTSEFYADYSHGRSQSICKRCVSRRSAELKKKRAKQKHESLKQECKNCVNYPCFEGMENIESNLAETCKSWHLRGKS